jgi:predicted MFS family arabinose efflux permease
MESSERAIVRVVAAAQFINVLEFIIVMPLGPDYAKHLGIPANQLSYVASSYTAAAAIVGVLGALFLDRFDRKKALVFSLSGLVLSTALAGMVHSFPQLVAARALAGAFGGPATSISLSIVADAVPDERRGRAMSRVLIANAIATTFGVPAGLDLAQWLGWRTPFLAIALLGVVVVLLATTLPPLTAHMRRADALPATVALWNVVRRPTVQLSYLMTVALQMSGFLVIPMLSPYLQLNLGFPRAHLDALYLGGGIAGLVATRSSGRLVDRFGSLRVAAIGLFLLAVVIVLTLTRVPPLAWIAPLFVCFFVALGLRNVAYNTLASKVPAKHERACFQSLQSSVGHVSIALGSALAARMLTTSPSGALVGIAKLGWISIAISALLPLLMWQVERRVNAKRASA